MAWEWGKAGENVEGFNAWHFQFLTSGIVFDDSMLAIYRNQKTIIHT